MESGASGQDGKRRRFRNPVLLSSASRRARQLWACGLLLLFAGFAVEVTVSRAVGLLVGLPGLAIVVLSVIRALTYRP